MRCPKCGFDSEDSLGRELEGCPKCGVVFRKLVVDRPPRPSAGPQPTPVPPPVSRGGGASLFNVVILSIGLSVSGYMAWKHYGEGSRPKPSEASTPGSEAAGSAQSGPGTTREVEVEVPVQRPETLMLPGFDKPAPGRPALEPPKAKPRLPALDESVVTLPLLERAKALALEYAEADRTSSQDTTARVRKLRSDEALGEATMTGARVAEVLDLPDDKKYSVAVLQGKASGQIFEIHTVRTTVGRSDADIVIDDPECSRQHAVLEILGASVVIRDMSSTNGTFVDGERIEQAELENHREFRIGEHVFMLIVTDRE